MKNIKNFVIVTESVVIVSLTLLILEMSSIYGNEKAQNKLKIEFCRTSFFDQAKTMDDAMDTMRKFVSNPQGDLQEQMETLQMEYIKSINGMNQSCIDLINGK